MQRISRRPVWFSMSAMALALIALSIAPRPVVAADDAANDAGAAVHAAAGSRPNIVMILADDLGFGDLSSYGAKDMSTPNIDGLVASGIRFDHFYSNCCVCSPSRASLMTGRYPELVGVPGLIRTPPDDTWGYLSPHAVLISTMLKRAGYHTAIVGKWNLGLHKENRPNQRGFDLFHGFLDDMMDDYYTHRRFGHNYMRLNEQEVDPKGHATDIFTQWAIDDIRERAKAGGPFFLYLAYNAPHRPIQPPPDWLAKVKKDHPELGEKRAKLVALIEHLDHGVGEVIKALKDAGVYDNTLIVFSSDNGGVLAVGANNGDLRGGKQDMYEGGIREPTCAVWPGHITPNSKTHAIAMMMDLFPTFCQVAGVKVDHKIDGTSILPMLLGQPQTIDRMMFWCRREGNARYQGQDYHAVRRGPWKLLRDTPFSPLELYNLDDDPLEQHDLASKDRRIFNELTAELRKQIQRGGAVPWQRPEVAN